MAAQHLTVFEAMLDGDLGKVRNIHTVILSCCKLLILIFLVQ